MRHFRTIYSIIAVLALGGLAVAATSRPAEDEDPERWLTIERALEMATMLVVVLIADYLRRMAASIESVRTMVRNESNARVAQIEALRTEVRTEGGERLKLEREERVARQKVEAELLRDIRSLEHRVTRMETAGEAHGKG